jgi:hypothetical protein
MFPIIPAAETSPVRMVTHGGSVEASGWGCTGTAMRKACGHRLLYELLHQTMQTLDIYADA